MMQVVCLMLVERKLKLVRLWVFARFCVSSHSTEARAFDWFHFVGPVIPKNVSSLRRGFVLNSVIKKFWYLLRKTAFEQY